MSYKYILMDADNTLYDFNSAEKQALFEAMSEYGVEITEEDYDIYHKINESHWKKLEMRETTRERLKVERFVDFMAYLKSAVSFNPCEFADVYIKCLSSQSQLIDGAEDVCRYLSAKYELYIITNGTSSVQHGRIDNSSLRKYFRQVFISDEDGR